MSTAVVVPVYRNGPTLAALAARLDAALDGPWTLRFVVDDCPAGGGAAADAVAALDPRVRVSHLPVNVGQHRALVHGLRAETDAERWVCLDGDLQDPPEAVPDLLATLDHLGASGVFAGRRGGYESTGRRITGNLHRWALARLTGLPADAGAYVVMDRALRDHVITAVDERGAPSVVGSAGSSGRMLVSIPVAREVRTEGRSAWTSRARLRQSVATLAWAARDRTGGLPARASMTALLWQLVRFGLVGALGFAAYAALYVLLRQGVPAQAANVVARTVIAITTAWLGGRFVFSARVSGRRLLGGTLVTLVVTTLISAAGLAIEQAVLCPDHQLGELATLAVAQGPAAVVRFLMMRQWVFRTSYARPGPRPQPRPGRAEA